ncbi:MAG: hypothetical protein BWY83_01384 [bacterium ADurb.Bin478]|nr:MAG: hypothetical protein BWY83_01384 [bacterium ADurb.Bin478]
MEQLRGLNGQDIPPLISIILLAPLRKDGRRHSGQFVGRLGSGRFCNRFHWPSFGCRPGRGGNRLIDRRLLDVGQAAALYDHAAVQRQQRRARRLDPAPPAAAIDERLAQFTRVQMRAHQLFIDFRAADLEKPVAFTEQLFTNLFGAVFRKPADDVVNLRLLFNAEMLGLQRIRLSEQLIAVDAGQFKLVPVFVIIRIGGQPHQITRLFDGFALLDQAEHSFRPIQLDLFRRGLFLDRHQGDVVILRAAFGERKDLLMQPVDKHIRRQSAVLANDVEKTFFAKQSAFTVHGLGDAVGIDEQDIILSQRDGVGGNGVAEKIFIRQRDADGKSVGIQVKSFILAGPVEDHGVVAGAGIIEFAPFGIDDDVEQGDEHALLHIVDHEIVDARQHLCGVFDAARFGAQRRPDHGHDQRAGHTFAGHVGYHNSQRVLVHLDKVVIVAAHLLGRRIVGGDLVALDLGEIRRQQRLLDLLRHLHLFLQAFLFRQVDLRLAQLHGDVAESLGDFADLGRGVDVHLLGRARLAQSLDPFGKPAERIHDDIDEQKQTHRAQHPDKAEHVQVFQPGLPNLLADHPIVHHEMDLAQPPTLVVLHDLMDIDHAIRWRDGIAVNVRGLLLRIRRPFIHLQPPAGIGGSDDVVAAVHHQRVVKKAAILRRQFIDRTAQTLDDVEHLRGVIAVQQLPQVLAQFGLLQRQQHIGGQARTRSLGAAEVILHHLIITAEKIEKIDGGQNQRERQHGNQPVAHLEGHRNGRHSDLGMPRHIAMFDHPELVALFGLAIIDLIEQAAHDENAQSAFFADLDITLQIRIADLARIKIFPLVD